MGQVRTRQSRQVNFQSSIFLKGYHYLYNVVSLGKFNWWKLLDRVGLVRSGGVVGVVKTSPSKSSALGRRGRGSGKRKSIRPSC